MSSFKILFERAKQIEYKDDSKESNELIEKLRNWQNEIHSSMGKADNKNCLIQVNYCTCFVNCLIQCEINEHNIETLLKIGQSYVIYLIYNIYSIYNIININSHNMKCQSIYTYFIYCSRKIICTYIICIYIAIIKVSQKLVENNDELKTTDYYSKIVDFATIIGRKFMGNINR